MSRDEDKLIRQLSLLSFLLSRPRPFTAREVQESVEGYAEMSDETFARRFYADRADLAKVGIEIQVPGAAEVASAEEAQLYFLPEGDYRLPGMGFTAAEQRALSLALAALDGRFAYARPLRLALAAILRGRPDPVRIDLEQLPVALAPDEDARRAGKQLSRLEEAVTRGKTVRFSYPPSGEGGPQERTFDPYGLFLIQSHWYVVGRDHWRDDIRTFRLGRIQGPVRFTTEKGRDFSVPAGYDRVKHGPRPPWLIGRVRGTATVRVGEDLAWWVKRLQPHVTWLADDDDGCSRFAFPFADETVLLSWVAGLGGCAELLEPLELRRRVRDLLTQVSRAHAGRAGEAGTIPGAATGPGGVQPASAQEAAGNDFTAAGRPRRSRPSPEPEDKSAPVAPEHLARAIALLTYLVDELRPALVSWQALEEDLGLTRVEVETDLSFINLVNFGGGTYALSAEAGPDGVSVVRDVMADTFSSPARLSPVMARALLLALDLLGDTFALEGLESLAAVREKIRVLVGEAHSDDVIVVDDVVAPDPGVVGVLKEAIRDRSVVALEYFTATRVELGERLVEPYLLFHSPDGWYLEGYCLRAEGQRTFKLERIRSARSTGAIFVPRPEVDLTLSRTGRAFSSAGVATWAEVRFHPRWRTYLDDRGAECAPLPDGELEVRLPYLDEGWMVREIIHFLGDAVLEHPASARRRVHESAQVLAARYAEEAPSPERPGDGR